MSKKPTGRPSKYKEEYCERMEKFFNRDPEEEIITKIKNKFGQEEEKKEVKACRLPTFEKFAVDIDVNTDTLHEWKKVHKSFSESYKKCQHLQKEILIQNGMTGKYVTNFAIFVAKNCTDMRDKKEVDLNETPNKTLTLNYNLNKDEE